MKEFIVRFAKDETGTAAVEYSLLATLICVPLVSAARAVADAINATFNVLIDAMK